MVRIVVADHALSVRHTASRTLVARKTQGLRARPNAEFADCGRTARLIELDRYDCHLLAVALRQIAISFVNSIGFVPEGLGRWIAYPPDSCQKGWGVGSPIPSDTL